MRLKLAAVVLVLLAAGCGGGDGEPALRDTAANLGQIRSGTLDAVLVVEPRDGEPFGFELSGPFELAEDGGFPVMSIDYTRIVEGERTTITLVSDGADVHAESEGQRLELSAEQKAELQGAAGALQGSLGAIELDDWIESADLSDGGAIGGDATDRVAGDLDVVAAVNGLAGLAGLSELGDEEAERLRDATESATYVVYTGKEDRLLRRLELVADFGLGVPEPLREALGDAVGAKVTFRLGVIGPNR